MSRINGPRQVEFCSISENQDAKAQWFGRSLRLGPGKELITYSVSAMCLEVRMDGYRMTETKRVQVTFTKAQWDLIETLRGELGDGDAEMVRNIVLAWLAEKSVLSTLAKKRLAESG